MDYHNVRKEFEPEPKNVKLVLLAESPPAADKRGRCRYFYDVNTHTNDSLFKESMAALGIRYGKDKAKGLRKFQRSGVLLLDVSYVPVNKSCEEERGAALERGYRRELVKLLGKLPRGVPVAIVVIRLYRCFAYRLREDGFNVINCRIPFPSRPKDASRFRKELARIASQYNIITKHR